MASTQSLIKTALEQGFQGELKAILSMFTVNNKCDLRSVEPVAHIVYKGSRNLGSVAGKVSKPELWQVSITILQPKDGKEAECEALYERLNGQLLDTLSGLKLDNSRELTVIREIEPAYGTGFIVFGWLFEAKTFITIKR